MVVCAKAHADVKIPYGELRPLSNYFVSLAESSERKTSADDLALRPIRERQATLRQDYTVGMQIYRQELDTYTAVKLGLQQKLAMAELGPEPSKLLKPKILIYNPTVEGIEIYAVPGVHRSGSSLPKAANSLAATRSTIERKLASD
jgi:hypothetical protein